MPVHHPSAGYPVCEVRHLPKPPACHTAPTRRASGRHFDRHLDPAINLEAVWGEWYGHPHLVVKVVKWDVEGGSRRLLVANTGRRSATPLWAFVSLRRPMGEVLMLNEPLPSTWLRSSFGSIDNLPMGYGFFKDDAGNFQATPGGMAELKVNSHPETDTVITPIKIAPGEAALVDFVAPAERRAGVVLDRSDPKAKPVILRNHVGYPLPDEVANRAPWSKDPPDQRRCKVVVVADTGVGRVPSWCKGDFAVMPRVSPGVSPGH